MSTNLSVNRVYQYENHGKPTGNQETTAVKAESMNNYEVRRSQAQAPWYHVQHANRAEPKKSQFITPTGAVSQPGKLIQRIWNCRSFWGLFPEQQKLKARGILPGSAGPTAGFPCCAPGCPPSPTRPWLQLCVFFFLTDARHFCGLSEEGRSYQTQSRSKNPLAKEGIRMMRRSWWANMA